MIEGFEEPARWVALPHREDTPDRVTITGEAARSGRAGLEFGWTDSLGAEPRGVLVPPGPFPLPAIGGPGFQPGQTVRISVGRQLAPVVIRGVADYFPTMTSSSRRFVVVSITDSGVGIAEEVMPHIFEAFYTTKPSGGGHRFGPGHRA